VFEIVARCRPLTISPRSLTRFVGQLVRIEDIVFDHPIAMSPRGRRKGMAQPNIP